MFERIVVPLDGSLTAEAILPYVRQILHRTDSEIHLLRVVVPAPIENSMLMVDSQVGAARRYLTGVEARLERDGVRVTSEVQVGSPIGVILDVVDERKSTMVALATHGSSGLKRMLLGSVAEGVLRKTPVPVLAVRPYWSSEVPEGLESRPIRNLLLPVDGSDLAGLAIPAAMECAELFESRVLLLTVLEPGKQKGDPKEYEEAGRHLQAMARSFEKKGVDMLQLLEKGDPAEEILKTLRFHEVDLIVMTTHGRSGISRLVTGSVTEQVLRQAPAPLLVVRAGKPARAKRREVASKRK